MLVQQMGDLGAGNVIDTLTGGAYTNVTTQLDRVELALEVSILSSVIAGMAAIALLMKGRD